MVDVSVRPLVNTPLQRGDCALARSLNGFSGFDRAAEPRVAVKTFEAVNLTRLCPVTPLRRDVKAEETA